MPRLPLQRPLLSRLVHLGASLPPGSSNPDASGNLLAFEEDRALDSDATILLVEDDEVDVMTVRRAFGRAGVDYDLRVAGHGGEALEYLRQAAVSGPTAPRPRLILLDLNLPIMNGLELLAALKSDGELRRIPVVVLSTSSQDVDVQRAYELGVAGYMVKPVEFSGLVQMVEALSSYWTLSRVVEIH